MLYSASLLAITRISFVRASRWKALLPMPNDVGRFVIRATRERGVGVPPSRSFATASHEASYGLSKATGGACVTVHATAIAPSTLAAGLRKGLTTLETAGDADGGLLFVPCGWCGKRVQETESGRRRRWCSDACRMKSYRAHRRSK